MTPRQNSIMSRGASLGPPELSTERSGMSTIARRRTPRPIWPAMVVFSSFAACGDPSDPGSTVVDPTPSSTTTASVTAPAPTPSFTIVPSASAPASTTEPVPPPPPMHDDSACGGCATDGLLRCDAVALRCVECLVAEDCIYGSRQQCIQGSCTNVDPAVTPCPATRVAHDSSCGFPGYTCIWGTLGSYSCRCGLGAPIGSGVFEPAVWMCGQTE